MDSTGSDRENAINDPLHSGYKAAQAEGLSKEQRLHSQYLPLDAVGRSVIATDRQGKIVYWYRGAEDPYGLLAEEAMGRSTQRLHCLTS